MLTSKLPDGPLESTPPQVKIISEPEPVTATLNPQAPSFFPLATPPDSPGTSTPELKKPPPVSPSQSMLFTGVPAQAKEPTASSSTLRPPPLTHTPKFVPEQASSSGVARPQTPTLPKINTDTSSLRNEVIPGVSPMQPLAPRLDPVSLPSTPTVSAQSSVSNLLEMPKGQKPPLSFFKGSLNTFLPPSSGAILSPLNLASPTATPSRGPKTFGSPFIPNGVPKPSTVGDRDQSNILSSVSPIKGKRKAGTIFSARSYSDLDEDSNLASPSPSESVKTGEAGPSKSPKTRTIEQEARDEALADAFARKGFLVKECFRTWRERGDKSAYYEAVKHSESYRNKVHSAKSSPERKRRISKVEQNAQSPNERLSKPKRRARRRISNEYRAPQDDEALVARFMEKQEEHQRRWATGTFLSVVRRHVKSCGSGLPHPSNWDLWLSLNPEVDATAIWLEKKFDVPAAGKWQNENIFTVPITPSPSPSSQLVERFPGLIIFECSPLEGVPDDLDRKYQILDDCARLRDIISFLPANRHFVPSLLLLYWAENGNTSPSSDILNMVTTWHNTSVLASFTIISLTAATQDPDSEFSTALKALNLDIEGRLVKSLLLQNIFALFNTAFDPFITEWISNCTVRGIFEWGLYCHLLQAVIKLLNHVLDLVASLTAVNKAKHIPELKFNDSDIEDAGSVYDTAAQWLIEWNMGTLTKELLADIQSQREMGRDFPIRPFLGQLNNVAYYLFQSNRPQQDSKMKFTILIADINDALEAFTKCIRTQQAELGRLWSMNLNQKRSKRRSASIFSDITSSDMGNLKKRRLSPSLDSYIGDDSVSSSPMKTNPATCRTGTNTNTEMMSPSPSDMSVSLPPVGGASVNGEEGEELSGSKGNSGMITVAMLRSLTKDMKKKYGNF